MHEDENRKRLQIIRHRKKENWNDVSSPGLWSSHLLSNVPTLSQSIRDVEQRFGMKIVNKSSS